MGRGDAGKVDVGLVGDKKCTRRLKMANPLHLDMLKKGVTVWNHWRNENPDLQPDLYGANLFTVDLPGVDFRKADLYRADLTGAILECADLRDAELGEANFLKAVLFRANLSGANLTLARLAETDLCEANLAGCRVYGVSAWGSQLDGANQQNLIITPFYEPIVTVDNLEVAQFVYLLLHNEKIRSVIDTIGKKGVLILGRFTEERKPVLDSIRHKLRELGFIPMMFDFERPDERDFTETVKILAGLSKFIIADITNPKSSPLELQATMPDYMIPFVPIIHEGEEPFEMFRDLKQKYGEWVLDILEYDSAANLLKVLDDAVVRPALEKSDQLALKKGEAIRKRHVKDYQ